MSADNYRTCPKCIRIADEKKQKAVQKANESYGKIPLEEWMQLQKKAEAPIILNDTLREDYYIGVDEEGQFEIQYSCYCSVCGFKFTYKHDQYAMDLDLTEY
jgi:hypothetical protein